MKLFHYLLRALHWTPDKLSTWYQYHNKKLKGLLLIAIVLFLFAKPSTADFRTEEDYTVSLGESLPKSIVMVNVPAGNGSGFFISPHEIITDEHVIHANNKVTTMDIHGKRCDVSVYYADSNFDLALLDTTCEGTPLKLADSVKVGQTAVMMGNPEDQQFFLSKGIVSNLSQYFVGFDAAAFPGDSGSPIVDLNGEVLGVARWVYKASSNVAVATNNATLSRFIATVAYLKAKE